MAKEEPTVEPTIVQFRDVTAAAYRIKKGVKETPLEVIFISYSVKVIVIALNFKEISTAIRPAGNEYIL